MLAASDLDGVKAGMALQARNDYAEVVAYVPQVEPVVDGLQATGRHMWRAMRLGLSDRQAIEFRAWVVLFFPAAPFYLHSARRKNARVLVSASATPAPASCTSVPPPSWGA